MNEKMNKILDLRMGWNTIMSIKIFIRALEVSGLGDPPCIWLG